MAAQVAIDSIPALARPPEVEQAISDARLLRDRAREAAEQVAAAQQGVDAAEQADVELAAKRARAGEPLGAEGKGVEKARSGLLDAQRAVNVTRLAQTQAEADVAQQISEHADEWAVALAAEVEQAREAARASIAALEEAARRLAAAAAAENWLATSTDEARFDRPARAMLTGTIAPSSRRRTSNSEPLQTSELIAYLQEAIEPPSPQASAPPLVQTPQA